MIRNISKEYPSLKEEGIEVYQMGNGLDPHRPVFTLDPDGKVQFYRQLMKPERMEPKMRERFGQMQDWCMRLDPFVDFIEIKRMRWEKPLTRIKKDIENNHHEYHQEDTSVFGPTALKGIYSGHISTPTIPVYTHPSSRTVDIIKMEMALSQDNEEFNDPLVTISSDEGAILADPHISNMQTHFHWGDKEMHTTYLDHGSLSPNTTEMRKIRDYCINWDRKTFNQIIMNRALSQAEERKWLDYAKKETMDERELKWLAEQLKYALLSAKQGIPLVVDLGSGGSGQVLKNCFREIDRLIYLPVDAASIVLEHLTKTLRGDADESWKYPSNLSVFPMVGDLTKRKGYPHELVQLVKQAEAQKNPAVDKDMSIINVPTSAVIGSSILHHVMMAGKTLEWFLDTLQNAYDNPLFLIEFICSIDPYVNNAHNIEWPTDKEEFKAIIENNGFHIESDFDTNNTRHWFAFKKSR